MIKSTRKCSECNVYSHRLGRCCEGKINPSKWSMKQFMDVVRFMGLSYVCNFNGWKIEYIRKAMKTKDGDI